MREFYQLSNRDLHTRSLKPMLLDQIKMRDYLIGLIFRDFVFSALTPQETANCFDKKDGRMRFGLGSLFSLTGKSKSLTVCNNLDLFILLVKRHLLVYKIPSLGTANIFQMG